LDKPTVGRIVHFVAAPVASFVNQNGTPAPCRPGIVVQVWPSENGMANLQVFNDGSNDRGYTAPEGPLQSWRTSIVFDAEAKANTWHWPQACPCNKPAKEVGAPPA
jgi:hypothetical protein